MNATTTRAVHRCKTCSRTEHEVQFYVEAYTGSRWPHPKKLKPVCKPCQMIRDGERRRQRKLEAKVRRHENLNPLASRFLSQPVPHA